MTVRPFILVHVIAAAMMFFGWAGFVHCYSKCDDLRAEAVAQDREREAQAAKAKEEYEKQKLADGRSIADLRAQLDRVRKLSSVRPKSTAPASGGSDGAVGKSGGGGLFLEGAELAEQGAEIARREHSALEACVRQYQRLSREYSPQ